jgi:adenine-specific DNA-methyltransferase
MDKLKFETKSGSERNIERLAELAKLFPEVITEAIDASISMADKKIYKKIVNWEKLRLLLGEVVEGRAESYDFTWVGKREALIEANAPIRKTLRPVKVTETSPSGSDSNGKPYISSGSVNWDTTQNLYIEGDNLDVLKLLTDSYLGKVKMIYIDPPYNTGNDFVYKDDSSMTQDDYDEGTDRVDADGNINYKENLVTNPRFHSDWCSMIYMRLRVARNLLTDDGAIFISIGDNEQANLKKLCDEVFGIANFVAIVPRIAKRTSDKGTWFRPTKDYILVYAKNARALAEFGIPKNPDEKEYKMADADGRRYKKSGASLFQPSLDSRPNQRYYIEAPDGSLIIPPGTVFPEEKRDGAKVKPLSNVDKVWRWSVDSYLKQKHLLIFTQGSSQNPLLDENGNRSKWNIYPKVYFDEDLENTLHPEDVIYDYPNSQATKELIALGIPFDFAKPSMLIVFLMKLMKDKESLVLDFFSGSASTAHAVMQLNAEDGGNRKFIMVQLPEKTPETSEAFAMGYKNICEIGKDRIRKAGAKIAEEYRMTAPNLDTGFRVFKLDESNFKDVHFSAGDLSKLLLFDTLTENLKADRTAEDLLYSCILEWGLSLTLPHTEETIEGKKVFVVNGDELIACFEKDLPESVIKAIAARKPLNALFRESCFKDSPAKINNEEIFKLISPSTKVKVL